MRIVAGQFGGRQIETPKGYKTHPMGERVRSALFNKLGDLSGKSVWDAFSGSGAIAIEAISRGASSALATEKDYAAHKIIKNNVNRLNLGDKITTIRVNCATWGKNNPEARFDIIICDPPYNDMQLSTVFALKSYLNPKGLMVLSYSGRDQVPITNGVVVVDNRNYGDAALAFYHLDAA